MIRIMSELSNFKGNPPTLADLRSKFDGRLKRMEGCTASECGYEIQLSNRVLAVLKIVPDVELNAQFSLRDGFVEVGMLNYTTTIPSGQSIVVHSQMDFNQGVMFCLHPWEDSSPLDTNGLVSVTAGASAAEKQSALALNVDCLTKFGGCPTVADLLPTIWQRSPNNTIKSRFPNHEGFIDAPGWIRH